MTRSHFVKAARKANPVAKKGEPYYWWKFRYGGKHYSKTAPKPSQLINSPFLSGVAAVEEQLGELTAETDRAALAEAVEDAKSQLQELADQAQESFDNMPEGLQQGDTGQLLEGRVSSIEDMIGELDGIDADDEDAEVEDILSEIQGVTYQGE